MLKKIAIVALAALSVIACETPKAPAVDAPEPGGKPDVILVETLEAPVPSSSASASVLDAAPACSASASASHSK